jgi:hypothetical protein
MAALTDAMQWYNLGGSKAARLKYLFKIEFFSTQLDTPVPTPGGPQQKGGLARDIFDCVRTVELPKYSIETEVVNSWNVRQLVPTKVNFEPISITFNDSIDNRFQNFIKAYMNKVSNVLVETNKSIRTGFDDFGLKIQDSKKDVALEKIVIHRFWGSDATKNNLDQKSTVTLWRPKIIDVQHDTLDYSASEAITWQISLRYESITYSEDSVPAPGEKRTQSEIDASNSLNNFPG